MTSLIFPFSPFVSAPLCLSLYLCTLLPCVGSAGHKAHAAVSLQSRGGRVNEHVTRAGHKPWHQWMATAAMIIVLLLLGI